MAEVVIPEGKWADQIPKFILPAEFQPPAPEPVVEAPKPAEAPAEPKPAEEATATEAKPAEETTGKDPEKATTRRFERRIDRAIRARAEAQAKADLLEKELTELKAKSVQPVLPGAPKMEDYTDVQEYAKAYAKFETDNVLKEREKKETESKTRAEQERLVQSWEEKVSEALTKYDDFDEIVGDLKPTTPWAVALMEEENGADIAHYLAKHQKEAQKIFSLAPLAQAREIGKLSLRLSQAPEAPKKPSKAPPPIAPVTGAAKVPDTEIKPQMSFEEYERIGRKMFRGR